MPLTSPAVFDLIERISASATPAAARNTYLEAGRRAGFTHGIACFDFIGSTLAATVYAETMPPGWMEEYGARGCDAVDPMALRNRITRAPYQWALADFKKDLTEAQRGWYSLNRDTKMHAGLNILDRSGGHMRIVGLAGAESDLHPHDSVVLHFAGLETMYRMQELGVRAPGATAAQSLSQREVECLKWIAAGKTDWEIGEILAISEKTVNVYVERAKHKLVVQTRSQAVVLAMRAGFIQI